MVRLRSITRALRRSWQGLPPWRRRLALVSLGLIAVLALVSGAPLGVLVGSWLLANGLFLLRLALWLVLHPRVLLRARRPVLAWALGAGSVLTLLFHAGIEPILAQFTEVFLPSGLIWLVTLGFLLLAVLMGLAVGCVGVALGGVLGGREIEEERLARVGTAGIWVTLTATIVVAGLLARLGAPGLLELAVAFGWPVFSLWLAPLVRHLEAERLSSSLHFWMNRHLVLRKRGRQGTRLFDLRALSMCLAGFLAAVLFAWAGSLSSSQSSVLLWMIREQSALCHLLGKAGVSLPGSPEAAQLVLVTWDNPALHDAHVKRSEPAVQAELVRRLTGWGATCVVVPVASLEPGKPVSNAPPRVRFSFGPRVVESPAPVKYPPDAALADQRQREALDLPKLLRAAREAGRTVIVLPEGEFSWLGLEAGPSRGAAADTNLAGLHIGTDRLPPFRVASLPALKCVWDREGLPPAPWLVLAAITGDTNSAPTVSPHATTTTAAGRHFAQIQPGIVLVDFSTCWPAEDFVRVPVSAVLHNQPVPIRRRETDAWIPPAEFFREKAVFLEAALPQRRPTPLGELSRVETLAYATRTLLGESALRPAPPWWPALWGCFWALAVGLTSAGRSLFGASARLAAAVVVIGFVSFAVFLTGRWLDPVFPIAAAGSAFLLVTQFSFVLERRAKDQNRALLQRFVAPEVVEELLADPEGNLGLGGRRERVVVLFADVRGFTQFAEEHSPEEVVKVVNAYLHVMTDALNQHGGLLDKYTGDGLMALFRIGSSESQAVTRALAAALAMRDAVLALSANRQAGGARSLQVGIALHVGEAVLGLVGNPVRQINYTALGHAVVVAARLQGLAGGGEVLVSEAVRAAAGGLFHLAAHDPVQVKGLSAPVNCYTVIERRPNAPSPAPTRLMPE
jgi:class 3 adenylate cyclase